jgi:hypothetical protein
LPAVLRLPNRKQNILERLRDTGAATCSIFALVIGAGLFSPGLFDNRVPVYLDP